jgi:hypothetical protein
MNQNGWCFCKLYGVITARNNANRYDPTSRCISMYHNTKQQDIKEDHDPQVGGRGSRFWRPIWKTIDDEFLHVGWNLEK